VLDAFIGDTYDFQNVYEYDTLNRQMLIGQQGLGGNFVGVKETTLAYDNAGRLTSLNDYTGYNGTSYGDISNGDTIVPANLTPVVSGVYTHDRASRLTDISWTGHGYGSGYGGGYGGGVGPYSFALDELSWAYDNNSRVTSYTNPIISGENLSYSYDHNAQLTGATGGTGNGSFVWDANGNSTKSGVVTGAGNRLLSDGTYNYSYDANGNMTKRVAISGGAERDFAWDNRNRLVSVTDKNGSGTIQQVVAYTYGGDERGRESLFDPRSPNCGRTVLLTAPDP
jgi:YD repeat-containing protein